MRRNSSPDSGILKTVLAFSLGVICLVFVSAGVIFLVEGEGDTNDEDLLPDFATTVYFVLVTISTVGYGDYSPRTGVGRAIICCVILTAAVMIPLLTADLISMKKMRSEYSGSYKSQARHVIVTGYVNHHYLRQFAAQFFHEDHGEHMIRLVILCERLPDRETRQLILDYAFDNRIVYLVGTPLRTQDLYRARFQTALACFLLSNVNSTRKDDDDAGIIMAAHAIHKAHPQVPIYAEVILRKNKYHLRESCKFVVCTDEIKLEMLAFNTVCPGVMALMGDLVQTSSPDEASGDTPWKAEYRLGTSNEIYRVRLSATLSGVPFSKASLLLFERYGVTLIGIEQRHFEPGKVRGPGERPIILNPAAVYILSDEETGFIIAQDKRAAVQVGSFNYEGAKVDDDTGGRGVDRATLRSTASRRDLHHADRLDDDVDVPLRPNEVELVDRSTAANMPELAAVKLGISEPHVRFNPQRWKEEAARRRNQTVRDEILYLARRIPHTEVHLSLNSAQYAVPAPNIVSDPAEISMMKYGSVGFQTNFVDRLKGRLRKSGSRGNPNLAHVQVASAIIDDAFHLTGHVVVCASDVEDLAAFVAVLRSWHMARRPTIVILTSKEPSWEVWSRISTMGSVFFCIGSPLVEEDLHCVNIERCSALVILASHMDQVTSDQEVLLNDRDAVMVVMSIQSAIYRPRFPTNVMCELVFTGNAMFLSPGNDQRTRLQVVHGQQPARPVLL